MTLLRRYWFEFQRTGTSENLSLGYGVTAHDYNDALRLLEQRVFEGRPLPQIVRCTEDVDVSTLDSRHVLPNIGLVIARGVWYPQGYEEIG
jgi:hypothetical protein